MKKNIIKLIGVIIFSFIMIFNVQFIIRIDDNIEKIDFRIGQNEALAAEYNYEMKYYAWGCRCEPNTGLFCNVSGQCLCSWVNC